MKNETTTLEKINSLIPATYNPRTITAEAMAGLKASIKRFGQVQEIVRNSATGNIVGGHQRLQAMKELGFKEVRVYTTKLTEDEEIALNIALNSGAISGTFTSDLNDLLERVKSNLPEDYAAMLLDQLRIEVESVPTEGLCDEDEVPEVPAEPKSKLGDLYVLGKHRLLCGDSTDILQVERLMNGEKPVLMVTDPPYGVKLDQSWRDEALGDKALGKGNANLVSNDDRADWYDVWAICNADIAYVWHASAFSDVVMDSLRRAGFDVRQQIIWNKSVMIMGRGAYHWKHEPCWYAVRKGCDANWHGDRKQVTVWDAAPPTHIMGGSKEERTSHPTQKPVLIYEIPIRNHTKWGDLLYEPFSGSGSAFISCEKEGRRVFGMELDPKYIDVIVARWEKFTGKKAELQNG